MSDEADHVIICYGLAIFKLILEPYCEKLFNFWSIKKTWFLTNGEN